ncbi:unnamed protein product [Nesidiocoris tenuis]|uniref:Cohesin subunit SCC3/SA HEAT-repeats domain-containing protein n=1 Tax=Nesidiocoris tenuis TaxID=355587 RepID=A0A6H5GHW6_9HEMI|nr:unnamed protein product [Nesidiocoris tenuis]
MAAKTLEYLCSEGFGIYTKCDVQRSTLIDSIVNKYKEAMDEWNSLIEGEETPDDDETYSVVNSLKKVSIFYSCHNLGNWNIWSSLFKDVEEAKDGVTSLPEEAVKFSISACYFAVLWDLHRIEELIEGGASTDDAIMESKSRQLQTNQHAALGGLVYEPEKELQDILIDFIQNNVFTYEEDVVQRLRRHNKNDCRKSSRDQQSQLRADDDCCSDVTIQGTAARNARHPVVEDHGRIHEPQGSPSWIGGFRWVCRQAEVKIGSRCCSTGTASFTGRPISRPSLRNGLIRAKRRKSLTTTWRTTTTTIPTRTSCPGLLFFCN